MIKEFKKYIISIGIRSAVMHQRVEEIYQDCLKILPEKPKDIFVDEYIDSDGRRHFECLNFITPKVFISADNFISTKDYRLTSLIQPLYFLQIINTDYDLKKATKKSHLIIEARFAIAGRYTLKASRGNCDVLLNITKKYFIPRLDNI